MRHDSEVAAQHVEGDLAARLAALDARLRQLGSVVVAFSGGADSAFLLAAAVRALGPERVVAATAVSSSLPSAELASARAFAEGLGVRHVTPATHEMERDGYRANAGDRCYFCKAELVDVLAPLAADLRMAAVVTGTNADDALAGFRPGIRAAAERGAATPLLDAGLTKAQIRAASRDWGLPTWDKPAAACLSSRIAYGIEVSPSRLARVERAEVALRSWLDAHDVMVTDLRVRDLGTTARIELDKDALGLVAAAGRARDELAAIVRDCGFEEAVVDPQGFRSGSMNELLVEPARFR
jgi:pyridinium-3,5-biscarboxylic acid mononucleotide sulfurtransferase